MSEPKIIGDATLYHGDCMEVLAGLATGSVQCVVTSPPYWGLRDYGADGQIGLEEHLGDYLAKMIDVFRAVRRVLADDGTLWLNMGDVYSGDGKGGERGKADRKRAHLDDNSRQRVGREKRVSGLPGKQLLGIPWRVAFDLQNAGWFLRCDIVWSKPNPMPESVKDRPTRVHEYIFLLSKSPKYFYDHKAIKENLAPASVARLAQDIENQKGSSRAHGGIKTMKAVGGGRRSDKQGRNKRTVWTVASQPFSEAHFATFPEKLIEPCILAGSRPGGAILDPFAGAGTVGVVCAKHGRRFVGVEINQEYIGMASRRIAAAQRQQRLVLDEVGSGMSRQEGVI